MSLFDKIKTQLKGLAHDTVDALSDDERTIRQNLRDMESDMEKIREAHVEANSQRIYLTTEISKAQTKLEKAIAYAQKQVNDAQAVLDNAEAGYKSWIESRSTICPYEKQLHHSVVSRFKDRLHKAEQLLEQIILSDASSWEWDV